jgi:hypothetical protein
MQVSKVRIHSYVALVVLMSAVSAAAAWHGRFPFPGWWPFGTFLVLATILEGGPTTKLRLSATGSISFVMHFASTLLFGGFWGATIAGLSHLLGNISRGNNSIRTLFNTSQIVLAVLAGVACYTALGGELPPAYLTHGSIFAAASVQRDLGLFFVLAVGYFLVNSMAVSGAIALNSDRRFREVWNINTRGVLGYDLGASVLALLTVWLYARFGQWIGFGSLGVILVVLPLVAVRHVYGLYRDLQESGQELLQVMVKAIEARDPYTSGHSLRVSRLSRTIALELGLSAKEVEQIETAALLHDVGKIHEEFAPLLRKEAKLTDEETALMQTHSARSADLVAIISKFAGPIQLSVRHHHERWDGQGYPDGLAEDSIPIGSRVILVSDTIDAMITDRPYRKRLPLEAVISELQKYRGSQFEPRIVDVATSSVAVRRLISEPAHAPPQPVIDQSLRNRLSWPRGGLWRVRRA